MKVDDILETKYIFFKAIALDEGGWYVESTGRNIGSRNCYRPNEGAVRVLFNQKFSEVNKEGDNIGKLSEDEIEKLAREEK